MGSVGERFLETVPRRLAEKKCDENESDLADRQPDAEGGVMQDWEAANRLKDAAEIKAAESQPHAALEILPAAAPVGVAASVGKVLTERAEIGVFGGGGGNHEERGGEHERKHEKGGGHGG